jgi:glycosyltransferase involved in cell wall biosynthesis
MRILFASNARRVGGSETVLRELVPRLTAWGFAPTVALPQAEGTRGIQESLRQRGIPVLAYQSLEEIPEHFDLQVVSAWYPGGYLPFLRRWPRAIIFLHDQIEVYYPWGLDRLYRLGYRLLQVPSLRQARAVLTVSNWAARFLKERYGLPQVYGIPNGVDPERFHPLPPEVRQELRAALGLKGYSVFYPARLSPEKNHGSLLWAARALPEVDFYLAGRGELEGFWRTFACSFRLSNVHFLGHLNGLEAWYQAVDAMVQPSWGENQSIATLEAMSSGLPIVTSAIPAQAELIEDGQEGLLVPPKAQAIVEALRWLKDHPQEAQALGTRARTRVLREHTLTYAAERFAQILHELI